MWPVNSAGSAVGSCPGVATAHEDTGSAEDTSSDQLDTQHCIAAVIENRAKEVSQIKRDAHCVKLIQLMAHTFGAQGVQESYLMRVGNFGADWHCYSVSAGHALVPHAVCGNESELHQYSVQMLHPLQC